MYKLSILVPSIRTHHWQRLYDSITGSCKRHSWELVFVGPFKDDNLLNKYDNIKHIHSYCSIPVCMQKATLECQGELICHTVDDGVLQPDALDDCIDYYDNHCGKNDIINMRYREGVNFVGNEFPLSYWMVSSYPRDFNLMGIQQDWLIVLQPLMLRQLFIDLGGFDCQFEYTNHCHHDFLFRVQKLGGKIHHSPTEVSHADHMPGSGGDHEPIRTAQEGPDTIKFRHLWGTISKDTHIDYDNWKQYDYPWTRRFLKPYETYDELCLDRGYGNLTKLG